MSLEGCSFDDVLLRPKKGVLFSRKDADISVPYLNLSVPLISAPMPSVASPQLIRKMYQLGGLGVVNRMGATEKVRINHFLLNEGNSAVAIGLNDDIVELYNAGIRYFVLDVAHAHSIEALSLIKDIKDSWHDVFLIAGNVATRDGARDLVDAGADAIKIGIGPGSVCTTRLVTGFGVPQLQAINEIAFELYPEKGEVAIIADGGIRNSGDIVKALAAGANAVMIGGLFARAIEANNNGSYYGCASNELNKHHAPEGTKVNIDSDTLEPLEAIVKRLTWGIRSGISYGGARNIRELQENAEWIRLTDAGRQESKL